MDAYCTLWLFGESGKHYSSLCVCVCVSKIMNFFLKKVRKEPVCEKGSDSCWWRHLFHSLIFLINLSVLAVKWCIKILEIQITYWDAALEHNTWNQNKNQETLLPFSNIVLFFNSKSTYNWEEARPHEVIVHMTFWKSKTGARKEISDCQELGMRGKYWLRRPQRTLGRGGMFYVRTAVAAIGWYVNYPTINITRNSHKDFLLWMTTVI